MNRNGYTGRLWEEEIFGRCRGPWDGQKYFTYRESMAIVKVSQPVGWDPGNPPAKKVAAKRLHETVAKLLGLNGIGKSPAELKLFTAIDTPLDRFHSVDGFFSFRGQVVSIDITLNPQKERTPKVDFVLHPEDLDGRRAIMRTAVAIATIFLLNAGAGGVV